MSIQRPDDSHKLSIQEQLGLDPFAVKADQFFLPSTVDNGVAYQSGNFPMMQQVDKSTGPGQVNHYADIAQRAAQIDVRLSQNRSY